MPKSEGHVRMDGGERFPAGTVVTIKDYRPPLPTNHPIPLWLITESDVLGITLEGKIYVTGFLPFELGNRRHEIYKGAHPFG